jgi:hypothetical protein
MNIIEAMKLVVNENKIVLRTSDRSVSLREHGNLLNYQDILADDREVVE